VLGDYRKNRRKVSAVTLERGDQVAYSGSVTTANALKFVNTPAVLDPLACLSNLNSLIRFTAPYSRFYLVQVHITLWERASQNVGGTDTAKVIAQGASVGFVRNAGTPSSEADFEAYTLRRFGVLPESYFDTGAIILYNSPQELVVTLDQVVWLESGEYIDFYTFRKTLLNGVGYATDTHFNVDNIAITELDRE
jgi:hypothetical protein